MSALFVGISVTLVLSLIKTTRIDLRPIWMLTGLALLASEALLTGPALVVSLGAILLMTQHNRWVDVAVVLAALLIAFNVIPVSGQLSWQIPFKTLDLPIEAGFSAGKVAAGFMVLSRLPGIPLQIDAPVKGVMAGMALALPTLLLASALGATEWSPQWGTGLGWLGFFLHQLTLVTLIEEALFRAWLIERLKSRLGLAVPASALSFGLAHFAGGEAYVILATLAGFGYALSYLRWGLLGAMGAHLGLNTVHALFLSYPFFA